MPAENVILSSPAGWEAWIQIIQAKAERKGIWGIIDPSKTDDEANKPLEEPAETAPPAADNETFATKMIWKMEYKKNKKQLIKYKKQKEALLDLRLFIL
jgi:hypothetical protein